MDNSILRGYTNMVYPLDLEKDNEEDAKGKNFYSVYFGRYNDCGNNPFFYVDSFWE